MDPMHPIAQSRPIDQIDAPISRRSLLRGGGAVGLTALTGAWLAPGRAVSAPARRLPPSTEASRRGRSAAHLVTNYRPSQPTGWPASPDRRSFGVTLGGHDPFKEFTFNGKRYRISLLSFGRSGAAPDPVYEHLPADATIDFKRTLAKAFDDHYSFRYTGGFKGREEISVQSYSVFVNEPTAQSPGVVYGADLYLVYNPDPRRGDPPSHGDLQWIQVVNSRAAGRPQGAVVDNIGRANPYYVFGGLTSIHGRDMCNFHDIPQTSIAGGGAVDDQFMAEVFLVQDTGTRDAAGKGVIKVFGGVKWGWQAQEVRS
jgi:hypothetical protein